jgi:hypothetical protein
MTDDIVELVKVKNRIEDVVAETYTLPTRGRYRKAQGEHLGGLVIDTQKQVYHWNSQGMWGDVIAWVQRRDRSDFKQAVEWLARRAGLAEPDWGKQDPAQRAAVRAREEALDVAARVFHAWLRRSDDALVYARRRGWQREGVGAACETDGIDLSVQQAYIGFSGKGLPEERKEMCEALAAGGVDLSGPAAVSILGYHGDVADWAAKHDVAGMPGEWIEKGYIPAMLGQERIVYPHFEGGRVRYLSARSIREKRHYNLPECLAGKRQMYFNHEYVNNADAVVVVEGQADALSLGQWGVAAVALAGVAAGDDLAKVITAKAVYMGLDADEAGKGNAWKVADKLGPMTRLIDWGEGQYGKIKEDSPHIPSDGRSGRHEGDEEEKKKGGGEGGTGGTEIASAENDPPRNDVQEGVGEGVRVKDANDLLRVVGQEGGGAEEQRKYVQEKLRRARVYVEAVAEDAGEREGAERRPALERAFKLINRMESFDLASHQRNLAALLKVNVREFNNILKTVRATAAKENEPGETVETLGGSIGGYLVEYLYDQETREASLAWRTPDGKVEKGEHVDIDGTRYIGKFPNKFIMDQAVLLPSDVGQLKTTRELVGIVELFVRANYLFETRSMARVISYYVLFTWLYDCFNALPYLRAMGEAGAGKSEMMRRIGWLCYRTVIANGANTSATFFRTTEMFKGTVFIDEADLQDGGDMANDIIKFLNLGAMKGNNISRLEEVTNAAGDKTFEPATFSTYCPKLIAMRREFRDDAVNSRSITFKLIAREAYELKSAGVKFYIDDEFRRKALAIRNLLLRWRLATWQPEIETSEDDIDLEISARMNQITLPLLAVAKDDPALQQEIHLFIRDINSEIVLTRSMGLAARVVEAIWKIHQYPDLRKKHLHSEPGNISEWMMIGDVTRIANEIMDEMNETREEGEGKKEEDAEQTSKFKKKDELRARGVGAIMRGELQLRVGRRKNNGFPVMWDKVKMEALAKRYGVDWEALPKVEGNQAMEATREEAATPEVQDLLWEKEEAGE